MTKEVNDIDELEALLAGLDDDELSQLDELDAPTAKHPVTDSDVTDAEIVEELPKPPRKTRPRAVAAKPAEPAPSAEDDDLASLADLETEITQEQLDAALLEAAGGDVEQAKMLGMVGTPDATQAKELALAEQVIDLLVSLPGEFGLDPDADHSAITEPVLAKIDANSEIGQIEKDLRAAFKKAKALTEPKAEETITVEAETRLKPGMQADGTYVVDDLTAKASERNQKVEKAFADAEASGSDEPTEDELDALLASVPSAAPAPKAAVSSPSKPVSVTPTKKVGGLNTFIDADQLQKDLHFTEATINDGMTRQAALFAHYARLSADATYQSDRAKQQVELLEAQLNQKFRDSMVMAGTKFTEKSIDAMVIQDSGYQAAQERAHEARAIASMVSSAADSFRHRKDMLIQVGADLRLEKQGELRMKEHPGQRAVENM
jgi:hypothetical protein